MCDSMEQKNVFYSCVWPFLAFFSMFALVIYPARGALHPHAFVDMLASHLPAGFSAPLSIIRNWSFALFYVMAEMWGSVVASLLFWGLANEVTTVDEAKKYCKSSSCRVVVDRCCSKLISFSYTRPITTCVRSIVWYGCQRRPNLFWTVRSLCVEYASQSCTWR